jgi:hypothetical protein
MPRKLFNPNPAEAAIAEALSSPGSAFDKSSVNKIESGSACEFLSRFNLKIQEPLNGQPQPKVKQSSGNLHPSKSLKIVENHVKFSKSEKTDLAIQPSKAEIYDNMQLTHQQQLYNKKKELEYLNYINKHEMVDLNNNENPVQEPKAPVRSSKLKRFVPARDLNKRLDINSQGQVINSYAEIPTGSSTNNTNNAGTTNSDSNSNNNCKNSNKNSENFQMVNMGNVGDINVVYQENSGFKRLLKSDKLVKQGKQMGESGSENNALKNSYEHQSNDLNANANNANYRNGLYIDFELHHDLKIKTQTMTAQPQPNEQNKVSSNSN